MRIVVFIVALLIAGLVYLNWPFSKSTTTAPVEAVSQANHGNKNESEQQVSDGANDAESIGAVSDESAEPQIREITLDAGTDFSMLMKTLGLENLEQDLADWALSRGYPYSDQTGTYLLEQPYDQYDDDTLRAFAENEDMWAQQFLAARLEKTSPAEALDWYRKAAINGSLHAMDKMTALYRKLDRTRADSPNLDDSYKEQVYAIQDGASSMDEMSFAWSVAAELAGSEPTRNRATASRFARDKSEEEIESACGTARGIYDDLTSARSQRGLGDYNRSPPPFMLGSAEEISEPTCPGIVSHPTLDLQNCEEIRVNSAGISNSMLVCSRDSG